jgi:hypothetical protein
VTERSTRPIPVEGSFAPGTWQPDEIALSVAQPRIVGWPDPPPTADDFPNSNDPAGVTTEAPQEIKAPTRRPAVVTPPNFGRRGLTPLGQWEGVVDDIEGDTFSCRIVRLTSGAPDDSDVEVTEFSLGDLANDDDRPLVQRGAVFYWTVGRARNEAGTVTNVSLIRFRRLPPPTRAQRERSEREAEELLRVLAVDD